MLSPCGHQDYEWMKMAKCLKLEPMQNTCAVMLEVFCRKPSDKIKAHTYKHVCSLSILISSYLFFISLLIHRLYRYVGYRAYTYWIHQRLGRYVRRATPACVVLAIRAAFPEERDEDYISYKDAEDEVGDAWRL